MAKVTAPLLSLQASGTLARSVSFHRRAGSNLARRAPVTRPQRSQAQQYQRWLYQDYLSLWSVQTAPTKASYTALANRRNTTPIAEWLRAWLHPRPDITASWHLDELTGLLALDFSHNANHGTLAGPTRQVLPSGRSSLLFDGIDDAIIVPSSPSLNIERTTPFTLALWLRLSALNTYQTLIAKSWPWAGYIWRIDDSNHQRLELNEDPFPTGILRVTGTFTHTIGTWRFIVVTYDGSSLAAGVTFYTNANQEGLVTLADTLAGTIIHTHPLYIGMDSAGGTSPLNANIVWPRIYSRALSPADILRQYTRELPWFL